MQNKSRQLLVLEYLLFFKGNFGAPENDHCRILFGQIDVPNVYCSMYYYTSTFLKLEQTSEKLDFLFTMDYL